LEGLVMEDVGIFYGHLVHFTVLCYILWTFGIVLGNLVYFSPFWYFVPKIIWQPCTEPFQNSQAHYGQFGQVIGMPVLYWIIQFGNQGCQMVLFQTRNPNLGKFWRALEWKM
jgi:hypothetical protein